MSNLVSKDQINKAKKFPMVAVLDYFGFQPCEQRGSELIYFSPFRNEKTPSFSVNINGNVCKDFGDNDNSGDVLRLYARLTGKTFLTCVHDLLNNKIGIANGDTLTYKTILSKEKKQPEIIEIKDRISNKNLIHYLESRCINPETANLYCKEIHYKQPNGKVYYGIGFPNNSGGYEVRSANFKSCFGTKDITTIERTKSKSFVRVFEGFFNFLSYLELTINWSNQHNISDYVILNSTSMAKKAMEFIKSKNIEKIDTFLDNDNSGHKTEKYIEDSSNHSFVKHNSYHYKTDLNDYLIEKLSK